MARYLIRAAISLAIGAALAYALYAGDLPLSPREIPSAMAVGGYAACVAAMHWFRASRWRHLLRPIAAVPLRVVVGSAWLGFCAVMFMPLRTGEVVRPLVIARRSEVDGWEAAGTVGAERVIDGVVLSSLLGLGLLTSPHLEPLPQRVGDLTLPVAAVPAATATALGLFVVILAVVIGFHVRRDRAASILAATVGRVAPRLRGRLEKVVSSVARGLDFLPSRQLGPFLLETAAYWVFNALGLWLLARGSGLPLGVGQACVVMGCLGLGILTPSAPGYFGTFQLSVYLALSMYVPPEMVTGPGASFVFVAFVGQLLVHVVGGVVGALVVGSAGDLAQGDALR